MKPTEKQIKVIDSILSIIKTWKNSNDIDSPTHEVEIRDFLYADLECENVELEDALRDLLYTIQTV